MATTAIWKVKGNLGQVVNYAANPDKTTLTTEDLQGLRDVMDYATQDYKTEEQRYVSGVELAQRLWGDRFQVVVATHLDREHIHNHFVLNSVSFVDGKKYNDCKSTYALMRQTSDQLCREHGLSVIEEPEQGRTMSYDTWEAEQKGKPTWYGQIRRDVDSCIARSFLFEHFLTDLKKQGYEVKTGKYIAVRPPGKQRFVRLKTLGDDYTEEAIRERIRAHEQPPQHPIPRPAPKRNYKIYHKPRKLTGFRALYFHYLYLLGKLKKPTASPRRRRYMTDEIIKFDRYVEQAKLLMKYRIDTWEQLAMLEEAVQGELDALCIQRKGLYTARRKNSTETDLSPAIESINQSIKILRRELKVCGRIETDGLVIRQKLAEPLPAPPKIERTLKQRPRKWQR